MTDLARRRTLLWRLGAILIALQVAITALVGGYGWSQLKSFHYRQVSRQLDRLSDLVADQIEGTDPSALAAEVSRLAQRSDVRITLVDADGRVLADSHEDPAVMDDHRLRPEIDAALTKGGGESVRFSRTIGEPMMYAAKVRSVREQPLVVRLATSVADADAQVTGLARVVAIAMAISLAITIAAISLLSRRLGTQVAQLVGDARRFATGDLSHRIPSPAGREFAAIAAALNDMAAQLETKISELEQQRREQQAIARSMSSGMLAIDHDQRILSVNRAAEQLLRIDGSAVRGRLLLEAARDVRLSSFVEEALAEGAPARASFDLETGRRAAVDLVSEPLFDVSGERIGLLLFIDDVTRIRRLERIRSDFAANVSHELRTPITTIRGSIETLLDVGCEDGEQTARFLAAAHRNTIRLGAIIEDLLSLARLEQSGSSSAAAEGELVELDAVVAGALTDHVPAAAARQISVETELVPGLAVRGVPQLLQQALGNLLANAINYSSPGTTVRVATDSVEGEAPPMVRISVRDEGPGIAAAHLPRLFERFYRVDKARSRASGGTGLGLAIVKHICLVHGGRPEVESRRGAGSTFHIVLPSAGGDDAG